eukprot:6372225-Pyramimonas_sp.AAC.1
MEGWGCHKQDVLARSDTWLRGNKHSSNASSEARAMKRRLPCIIFLRILSVAVPISPPLLVLLFVLALTPTRTLSLPLPLTLTLTLTHYALMIYPSPALTHALTLTRPTLTCALTLAPLARLQRRLCLKAARCVGSEFPLGRDFAAVAAQLA